MLWMIILVWSQWMSDNWQQVSAEVVQFVQVAFILPESWKTHPQLRSLCYKSVGKGSKKMSMWGEEASRVSTRLLTHLEASEAEISVRMRRNEQKVGWTCSGSVEERTTCSGCPPPPTISKTITVRLSAFSLNHGNVTLQRNKVFSLYIKQKGKYEAGEMM